MTRSALLKVKFAPRNVILMAAGVQVTISASLVKITRLVVCALSHVKVFRDGSSLRRRVSQGSVGKAVRNLFTPVTALYFLLLF